MTLDKFKEEILGLALGQFRTIYKCDRSDDCLRSSYDLKNHWNKANYKPYEAIFAEWSTGGITGGSCWHDGGNYGYTTGNPPEELTDLDIILTHFRPNTTFLEHRKLTQELTKTSTRSEGEYYGNSTDYTYRYILIDELHRWMESMEWLKP